MSAGASPAMQPVVRRLPAKRCAPLVPWPSLAPAVGNSRGCAEQFAHAPCRRRAVCVGGRVTRDAACGASAARKAVRPVGSLAQPRTCGGQFARLRRAIRARAVPAQGCLCRRARHPRCGLWCGDCPQSGAPCWFLGPASHLRWAIRAAAPSNSRTRRPGAGLSVSAGASPAMRPVVRRLPAKRCALLVPWPSLAPAVGNSRGCAEQFAHAPSRRRAFFQAGAAAFFLFYQTGAGL